MSITNGFPMGGSNTVDTALSTSSTNPVQNKVITSALANKNSLFTKFAEGTVSTTTYAGLNQTKYIVNKNINITFQEGDFILFMGTAKCSNNAYLKITGVDATGEQKTCSLTLSYGEDYVELGLVVAFRDLGFIGFGAGPYIDYNTNEAASIGNDKRGGAIRLNDLYTSRKITFPFTAQTIQVLVSGPTSSSYSGSGYAIKAGAWYQFYTGRLF